MESPRISSIAHMVLDLPPSCIEFAPAGLLEDYFVVGTYHLELTHDGKDRERGEEEDQPDAVKQVRSGSLMLFQLQAGPELLLRQTIRTPFAVLDLHFSSFESHVFGIATSSGSVGVYSFESDHEQNGFMKSFASVQVADPSILVLSLAWHPSSTRPSTIAVSLSSGQVRILDYKASDNLLRIIQSHTLEAWTVVWSTMGCIDESCILYSGGDDSTLCTHAEVGLKSSLEKDGAPLSDEVPQSISCDVKTHGAGITAILPIATGVSGGEILLTGSYDEYLRILIPLGIGKRSKVLAEKQLGGGVWRLKLLGANQSVEDRELELKVLASCMHAGTRVVEIKRSKKQEWAIKILACFEEHESMNYASDTRVEMSTDGLRRTTYVSTSFYDRKLCVWKIKDD